MTVRNQEFSSSSQDQHGSKIGWKFLCTTTAMACTFWGVVFLFESARGLLAKIGGVLLGIGVLSSAILLGNYIFNKVGSTRRYDVLDFTQSNDFPSSSVLNVNTVNQDNLELELCEISRS